jgi:hypothetical protein
MYTKDEFYKYYIDGKAKGVPIHTTVDLNKCGTAFYKQINGVFTGTIYPIESKQSDKVYAMFVSDTTDIHLHDGNTGIDCPDDRFYGRCWYINYKDYIHYKGKKGFKV